MQTPSQHLLDQLLGLWVITEAAPAAVTAEGKYHRGSKLPAQGSVLRFKQWKCLVSDWQAISQSSRWKWQKMFSHFPGKIRIYGSLDWKKCNGGTLLSRKWGAGLAEVKIWLHFFTPELRGFDELLMGNKSIVHVVVPLTWPVLAILPSTPATADSAE